MAMDVSRLALAAMAMASVIGAPGAHAQATRRVEPPTGGLELPTTPLAGEHDARAVVANPGGLALVRGSELTLALDLEQQDVAAAAGQGFGAYAATTLGGQLVPRLGLGVGLEWLRPTRDQLAPDPGQPFRFSLGAALGLGRTAGLGVTWHHFHAASVLDGVDTFDLGLSWRLANFLAIGGVVRDLATSDLAGVPVERRYEAELVVRPAATDRLELGLGGRVGEIHGDVDGWARAALRVARGVYVQAELEDRARRTILADADLATADVRDGRDLRATVGLELSFGGVGVATQATGLRAAGANHLLGGTFLVHAASVAAPSVLGTPDHIERVELAGTIGVRELTGLVARLRAIGRDPTAKAVVVTFDAPSAGWATFEELRDEIVRLRQAGKKIFAYLTSGTGRDYYVASAAHKIYIDPVGGLRLVGMAGSTMYFRGAFDLLGVVPQFEKIGEYKSAPEQFTETGPTPVAAGMRNEMFESLWQKWLTTVAEARHLTPAQVTAIVDGGPYTAGALAHDSLLVDAVAGPDKISQLIVSELGEVMPIASPRVDRPERWERPGVAIVYVDGDITDGKSRSVPLLGENLAGGETLLAAIAAARADPRIGAIILRINSPGGSAVASELVAREVFATRGVKPILCSMADVAASGGYFVAAGCDLIFAEPMTITGSIGIFTGKFDVGGLAKKLGISVDTVKHGAHADLESMYRPYTDEERAVVRDGLHYAYGRFVAAVAEGRALSRDAVDAVGRGHVWTGAQAAPIHLVDRFGGLEDAIDEAKRRLGLATDTRVQLYELPSAPPSLLGALGSWLGASEAARASLGDLPMVRSVLRGVPASILVAPATVQARLPFEISWD
ncbi:MAG TPA: signal peptide peptidase SppA [Kofleriaceae bacterium]|nr:signal peptide peptidase SppA [Kofleriaceae bacterium]